MSIENKALSDRGFKGGEFIDRYGSKCSIQESSMAATEGDGEGHCIWLGINTPECKVLVPGHGWQDVTIPEDALHSGRMHLSQRNVRELLPHLQFFAEAGWLPNEEQLDAFTKHLDDNNVQGIINGFFDEVST